jgi:gliding motility-associated-like protein
MHTYLTWGDYYVTQTVTNTYACPNTMTLLVRVLPEFRFWIPNAFTPGNKDHLNDVFKPIVIGVEDYTFMIFNRWGELIFKTNDTEAGWNGTYKDAPSPMDVYVWKCEFKNIVSKENESRIGHVTLVR